MQKVRCKKVGKILKFGAFGEFEILPHLLHANPKKLLESILDIILLKYQFVSTHLQLEKKIIEIYLLVLGK